MAAKMGTPITNSPQITISGRSARGLSPAGDEREIHATDEIRRNSPTFLMI
jgi:hypothetical protein